MDSRLFPVSPDFFRRSIKPLIDSFYSKAGRPPSVSDYHVFCAMLYVLREGIHGALCRPATATGTTSTNVSSGVQIVESGGMFSINYSKIES